MAKMTAAEETLNLERLRLPAYPRVQGLHVHDFTDSLGDPAINVSVTLAAHPEGGEYQWSEVKPIQDEIFRALREAGDTRFAYVSFAIEPTEA
jgi:hypothetical protein